MLLQLFFGLLIRTSFQKYIIVVMILAFIKNQVNEDYGTTQSQSLL